MFLLVYVDNIIITRSSRLVVQRLIHTLAAKFKLKDMGKLKFSLGMELTKRNDSVNFALSQQRYTDDLLTHTNMKNCKLEPTPMTSTSNLSAKHGESFNDKLLYRSTVGGLLYLVHTNIAFIVNKLCQFVQQPTTTHWAVVKRFLRYLHGTPKHGLLFTPSNPFVLEAYTNADWVGSIYDRRSTGGFAIFLGQNLVAWSAKKQPSVPRSTTEAEFCILADAAAKLKWIQYLLQEIGFK